MKALGRTKRGEEWKDNFPKCKIELVANMLKGITAANNCDIIFPISFLIFSQIVPCNNCPCKMEILRGGKKEVNLTESKFCICILVSRQHKAFTSCELIQNVKG